MTTPAGSQALTAISDLGASYIAQRQPTSPLASSPVLTAVILSVPVGICVVAGLAMSFLNWFKKKAFIT